MGSVTCVMPLVGVDQVRALPKLRILVIGLLMSFQSIGYACEGACCGTQWLHAVLGVA